MREVCEFKKRWWRAKGRKSDEIDYISSRKPTVIVFFWRVRIIMIKQKIELRAYYIRTRIFYTRVYNVIYIKYIFFYININLTILCATRARTWV